VIYHATSLGHSKTPIEGLKVEVNAE